MEKALQPSGDLTEGQELVLAKTQEKAPQKKESLYTEPGIDYRREILHGEKKLTQENNREIATKIQEILIELKQLMHSSQELQVQFKQVAVEPEIANPGKYHVSFFSS